MNITLLPRYVPFFFQAETITAAKQERGECRLRWYSSDSLVTGTRELNEEVT